MKITHLLAAGLVGFTMTGLSMQAAEPIKTLLIDGQNNHDWKGCTPVLKRILESSGRFTVAVSTTPGVLPGGPKAPKAAGTTPQDAAALEAAKAKWSADKADREKKHAEAWSQWHPDFSQYQLVVMNYTGDPWPVSVRNEFQKFVQSGGGLVIYHAADNAFPEWPEFNEMIAVGGWGGRNEKSGPMVRWRDGKVVLDTTPGAGGTHGPQHEFIVEARVPNHPIMEGLPLRWKHVSDELYSKLRGPAKNLTVLATAYADPAKQGSGENEPMLMTITFGKGRVFHTTLGHGPDQLRGLGFQITLLRGSEWAGTGRVTIPAPAAGELTEDKAAVKK
jgi:type 1 glutamine amidotransferase